MKEKLARALNDSLSYLEYMDLMNKLVLSQDTTGEKDPERIEFTALNYKRSLRLNKTIGLTEAQKAIFDGLQTKTGLVAYHRILVWRRGPNAARAQQTCRGFRKCSAKNCAAR